MIKVNFISINNFSTIPVLRYVMEDLAKYARITVVNCVITAQPLNVNAPVSEIAIGRFATSTDFNRQSVIFKVLKYLKIYWYILTLMWHRNQIFVTHDYQVLRILLSLPFFRSRGHKVVYYQFELFDYAKLPQKDRRSIDVIKRNVDHLDLAIFPETHRMQYFCELTGLAIHRTIVIPNSCRVQSTSQVISPLLSSIPSDAIVFGHIGNVGPDHYIHEFLSAINMIQERNVYFLMVGRYSDKVKDLFKTVSNPNFILIEEVSHKELATIYPRIDYGFILYKGIDRNFEYCAPNKLYEYWAFGIPVFAHKLGGLVDVIKPPLLGSTIDFESGELIPRLKSILSEGKPDREKIQRYFEEHLTIDQYLSHLRTGILFQ